MYMVCKSECRMQKYFRVRYRNQGISLGLFILEWTLLRTCNLFFARILILRDYRISLHRTLILKVLQLNKYYLSALLLRSERA